MGVEEPLFQSPEGVFGNEVEKAHFTDAETSEGPGEIGEVTFVEVGEEEMVIDDDGFDTLEQIIVANPGLGERPDYDKKIIIVR